MNFIASCEEAETENMKS